MSVSEGKEPRPRLRRTVILCAVCVCASGLGMLLARPVASQFHAAAAWVLPVIAVAVLLVLFAAALAVLPRRPGPRS